MSPWLASQHAKDNDPTEHPAQDWADDLGSDDRSTYLEEAGPAKRLVLEQNIVAFGRRPVDYLKRDLLLGGALSDQRNWAFYKILKEKPAWLFSNCHKNPQLKSHLALIAHSRAFDYLHRIHTLNLLGEIESRKLATRLDRVARCATSLYQIQRRPAHRTQGIRGRKAGEVCNQAWICPHCYARQATKDFVSIKENLTSKLATGFLVQLSLSEELSQIGRAMTISWRDFNKSRLVEVAQSIGATGGLWSFQIAPTKDSSVRFTSRQIVYSNESLEGRVSVLAYIPEGQRSTCQLDQLLADPKEFLKPSGVKADIDVRKAAGRTTLRKMLIGCWPGNEEYFTPLTSHSIFYWPPVWLCSLQQWTDRVRILRNCKRFQYWGNWLANNHLASKHSPPPTNQTPLIEKQRSIAKGRRTDLLPQLVQLSVDLIKRHGSRPGRVTLSKEAAARSIDVSERDIRWFLREHATR